MQNREGGWGARSVRENWRNNFTVHQVHYKKIVIKIIIIFIGCLGCSADVIRFEFVCLFAWFLNVLVNY